MDNPFGVYYTLLVMEHIGLKKTSGIICALLVWLNICLPVPASAQRAVPVVQQAALVQNTVLLSSGNQLLFLAPSAAPGSSGVFGGLQGRTLKIVLWASGLLVSLSLLIFVISIPRMLRKRRQRKQADASAAAASRYDNAPRYERNPGRSRYDENFESPQRRQQHTGQRENRPLPDNVRELRTRANTQNPKTKKAHHDNNWFDE